MFDDEFKAAIQHLSSDEKDKLIFRLLKKDLPLAKRLYYELIETDTVEQKRDKLFIHITDSIKKANSSFYSLGYLLMDIRSISGEINEHLRLTKDKYGEISLNIHMLTELLTICSDHLKNNKPNKCYTINIYVIARAFKILLLIKALNEDYLIEFKKTLNELGHIIGASEQLMRVAINNGLDINWLLSAEIPEDIVALHKELRLNGFLK